MIKFAYGWVLKSQTCDGLKDISIDCHQIVIIIKVAIVNYLIWVYLERKGQVSPVLAHECRDSKLGHRFVVRGDAPREPGVYAHFAGVFKPSYGCLEIRDPCRADVVRGYELV